jgi:hypothetical protein
MGVGDGGHVWSREITCVGCGEGCTLQKECPQLSVTGSSNTSKQIQQVTWSSSSPKMDESASILSLSFRVSVYSSLLPFCGGHTTDFNFIWLFRETQRSRNNLKNSKSFKCVKFIYCFIATQQNENMLSENMQEEEQPVAPVLEVPRKPEGKLPKARSGHCMAYDVSSGLVFLYGGAPASPLLFIYNLFIQLNSFARYFPFLAQILVN